MSNSAEKIQILYEISMSIGLSMDLRKMVKIALSAYMKKLNCAAGCVFQISYKPKSVITMDKVYTIPRHYEAIENCIKVI